MNDWNDAERELMDDGPAPGPTQSEFIGDRGAMDASVSSDERTWGLIAHLSILSGYVVPSLGCVGGPLIVDLIKKDDGSPFVRRHATEALNAGISMMLYMIISGVLALVLIGFVTMAIVAILAIVCSIVGGIAANEGRDYRWPFILRLVN